MGGGSLQYYASLARTLSPSELARAAARKALRGARRAVGPALPSASDLLGHLNRPAADQIAQLVFSARERTTWCDTSRRSELKEVLRHAPGALERALARAEAARLKRFDVFGQAISFEATGRTDWSWQAQTDPKLAWVIGRLDQLIALGQGYWVAPEAERPGFVEAFIDEATDFIRRNPVGQGVQWECPMEVALRGANLAQALTMFSDAAPVREPELLLELLAAIGAHANWVESHLEDDQAVPNNHLIADLVGLFTIGALFPVLPRAKEQVALATSLLEEQVVVQVYPDGCSFEGSLPYHRLTTELLTLAHVVGSDLGLALGPELPARLKAMVRVSLNACSERGLVPQLGDNDSGRVFPFQTRPSLDHGYLAPLGAALYEDPYLKPVGATYPDEAIWLLGAEGYQRFVRLEARGLPRSFVSKDAGWAVLRGGGAVLAASVGKNGQRGVGGHSHNDKLSFELHLSGRPAIVDPGTGSYGGDPTLRNLLRSTAAHNAVQVDGQEQSPIDPERLFALIDAAGAQVTCFSTRPGLDKLGAGHRGYRRLADPVEVERTFFLDKEAKVLCVNESLLGEGAHGIALRLHLPDDQVVLREATPEEVDRVRALANAPRSLGEQVAEIGARAVVCFGAGFKLELEESLYSPGYGQVQKALALVVQRQVRVPVRFGWVVMWN